MFLSVIVLLLGAVAVLAGLVLSFVPGTLGVALVGAGCFLAVVARMAQAESQHGGRTQELKEIYLELLTQGRGETEDAEPLEPTRSAPHRRRRLARMVPAE